MPKAKNSKPKIMNLDLVTRGSNILIRQDNISKICEVLLEILADEFKLYNKTQNAHLDFEESNFYSMHSLFEAQYYNYNYISETVGKFIEQIKLAGHFMPELFIHDFEFSQINNQSNHDDGNIGSIRELISDHVTITMKIRIKIRYVEEELKETGIKSWLIGWAENHEKTAYLLSQNLT